jgi:hypothetical protein
MNKNEAASALGKLGKGKPKTLTQEQRDYLREVAVKKAQEGRRKKKEKEEL